MFQYFFYKQQKNRKEHLKCVLFCYKIGLSYKIRKIVQTNRNKKEELKMSKKTIKDIDVKGKKVLVRCDFNVP